MHPDLIPTFLIGLTAGFIAGGLLGFPIGGFLMWWQIRNHDRAVVEAEEEQREIYQIPAPPFTDAPAQDLPSADEAKPSSQSELAALVGSAKNPTKAYTADPGKAS